jgi:hypothetical protein
MAAHKHGKLGRVTIGGVNYKTTEWTATHEIAGVEVTNTESNGYQEMDDSGGIEKLSGSCTIVGTQGGSPPANGATATFVLYEGGRNATDALAFNAFIGSIQRQNQVRSTDPVTWQVSFESSGEIAIGSTTVPTAP